MRLVPIVSALVAAVIGAGILYLSLVPQNPVSGVLSGQPANGGPFQLVDTRGRIVTDKDFLGAPVIIYFGYTFCPDLCPTELQTLSAARDRLGDKGKAIKILFVTVDPERDTPSVMGDFAANFGPQVIGLTGSPEQIAAAAKVFGVYYQKIPLPDAQGEYAMDHSTAVYALDKDGKLAAIFSADQNAEQIAASLKKLLG
jgi:protein SCO1/2